LGEAGRSLQCAGDESGQCPPIAGGSIRIVKFSFDNAKRRRDVAGLHVWLSEHGQCVLVLVVTNAGVVIDTAILVNNPLTVCVHVQPTQGVAGAQVGASISPRYLGWKSDPAPWGWFRSGSHGRVGRQNKNSLAPNF
jgi:hypothetical protein